MTMSSTNFSIPFSSFMLWCIPSVLLLVLRAHAASLRCSPSDYCYGSGHFGSWFMDSGGLPCYNYTCDQASDPSARTKGTNAFYRSETDHTFQIGNDRLVALVSNYGYLQVRQDEGGPKIRTDYSPPHNQYGAGFGYLSDATSGSLILSSFINGSSKPDSVSHERHYGVGYARKICRRQNVLSLDHLIVSPFGDDPVLLSHVKVFNNGPKPLKLLYTEVWSGEMRHLDRLSNFLSSLPISSFLNNSRNFVDAHYLTEFSKINSYGFSGVRETFTFAGLSGDDLRELDRVNQSLSSASQNTVWFAPLQKYFPPRSSLWDPNPLDLFVIDLGSATEGIEISFSTNCDAFFGFGGVHDPTELSSTLPFETSVKPNHGCFVTRRNFAVDTKEGASFSQMWGYLPEGFTIDKLVSKYGGKYVPALLEETQNHWRSDGIHFDLEGSSPWIQREILWNNYYMRSALTFDTFFNETILDQGTQYRYINGFQGAARDPLQHVLPLIFTHPSITKSVLRYTLSEIQTNSLGVARSPRFFIPYGLMGHGLIDPCGERPSDLELWLLMASTEYVLATKDFAFLSESITTYQDDSLPVIPSKVIDLLVQAFEYVVHSIGIGQHGLLHMQTSDWSDIFLSVHAANATYHSPTWYSIVEHAESVLNSVFATYVLPRFAFVVNKVTATEIDRIVTTLADSIRSHAWSDRWLSRAFLSDEYGWTGTSSDQLCIEPQPWAILSPDLLSTDEVDTLVSNIDTLLRDPSPIGAMQMSKGYKSSRISPPGTSENGGVWPAQVHPLVWALSKVNNTKAFDEWQKASLAVEAENFPTYWWGIWSSSDVCSSELSESGGGIASWPDYPILCTHRHSWPLWSATKLAGIEFDELGVVYNERLAKQLMSSCESSKFDFHSPLVSFELQLSQNISSATLLKGHYQPSSFGSWRVKIVLDHDAQQRERLVTIQGKIETRQVFSSESIDFHAFAGPQRPMKWSVDVV